MLTGHLGAIVFGAIRGAEAQVGRALDALDRAQPEEVRAELQGALLCLSELAETLGRK